MRDRLPLALRFYRLAAAAAAPVTPRLLAWRLKQGKEHPVRMAERYGEPSLQRPPGPIIWLHTASVGELLAVIPLIERIRARNFAVLVTSARSRRPGLPSKGCPPERCTNSFRSIRRGSSADFLDYWRPALALFVELDLWPNLVLACAEHTIPMILVNGRVSERSFGRWRLLPRSSAALLDRFDMCLAQSSANAQRLDQLGAPRVSSIGNLKLDVPAPPVDQPTLHKLSAIIGSRVVIAAASTHAGEESAIIAAHRRLRVKCPSLLTVIAPRHPARGPGIAEIGRAAGLAVALRSRGDPPKPDIDVYIADTLGELGLIYRLAPIVFMGGSLATHGGQNPIEAIGLGAAIVHGPHVWNFAEIYATLDAAHGAELVSDADALTARLAEWLAKPAVRSAVADAGKITAAKLGGALERTLAALEPYLVRLRLEQQAS